MSCPVTSLPPRTYFLSENSVRHSTKPKHMWRTIQLTEKIISNLTCSRTQISHSQGLRHITQSNFKHQIFHTMCLEHHITFQWKLDMRHQWSVGSKGWKGRFSQMVINEHYCGSIRICDICKLLMYLRPIFSWLLIEWCECITEPYTERMKRIKDK